MAMLILPPNWPNVGFFPEILVDWTQATALGRAHSSLRGRLKPSRIWPPRWESSSWLLLRGWLGQIVVHLCTNVMRNKNECAETAKFFCYSNPACVQVRNMVCCELGICRLMVHMLGTVYFVKFFWFVNCSTFFVIWQLMSNHELIRLKRFVSSFTVKLRN